jgi:hypothetical protein
MASFRVDDQPEVPEREIPNTDSASECGALPHDFPGVANKLGEWLGQRSIRGGDLDDRRTSLSRRMREEK